MFKSTANITYQKDKRGIWITAYACHDLVNYYWTLIPKRYRVVRPRWPAHVTIVRPEDNTPLPLAKKYWEKHGGRKIGFIYDPFLIEEKGIWWFNLWSREMETIRKELKLPTKSRITVPPPGYCKTFHCTIAYSSLV
ncbi:hypothetical protein E2P64_08360 [Candidatus Bathyarchaeota archaeon]|nr:hypothetical protein E2P64_08360 [Candidatus Bathyarchaeota archaeon]